LRPASNCFSAPIICASVCLLFDILPSPFLRRNHIQFRADSGDQVTMWREWASPYPVEKNSNFRQIQRLRSGQLNATSCLIVDVEMPGMNGLRLQSHLAACGCGIPIIFITAYDDKESRQRAMQAGAVAFLGKPFSDERLLQTIRSALRQDKGGTKTT
jgi:CheY-like chemotaxis protein